MARALALAYPGWLGLGLGLGFGSANPSPNPTQAQQYYARSMPGLGFFVLMTFAWPLLGGHLLQVLSPLYLPYISPVSRLAAARWPPRAG